MPSSRILIASNTLTSSAASVTFSSIPGTYTDLVLKWSVRNNDTGSNRGNIQVSFNTTSPSGTSHSYTWIAGTGSAASSSNASSSSLIAMVNGVVGGGATASTFSNGELYIPSYTVSQNKPIGSFQVGENNATDARMSAVAGLWTNTSAITTIYLESSSGSFVSGSSFFLYGISNT